MNEKLKKISEEASAKLIAMFSSEEFKALITKTKQASDTGSFKMIVSSEHMDRQGEIVMQDGIDTSNYMKNPIVLNSHDYYGIDNIVGVTESITKEVVNGVKSTVAIGKFAPTESGQLARSLYEGGFLNACSIGFIAKAFDAKNECVITQSEMLEWSFCSVPANAAALRLNSMGAKEVTAEILRAKGFASAKAEGDVCSLEDGTDGVYDAEGVCVMKEKPKAAGDVCTMDDGSEGTMQDDGNGGMACVKTTTASADEEKASPCAHVKAGEKMCDECIDAKIISDYYEKAEYKEKDAQQIGAIIMTMQNIIDSAIVTAGKLIMDILNSEYAKSELGKKAIAEMLKSNSFESIKTAIADAEKKLGIGEGEEHLDGGAPNERSEDSKAVPTFIRSLDEHLQARELLKSISTFANQSLERMNENMRKERAMRKR